MLGPRYRDDGIATMYLDQVQRRAKQQVEHKVADGTYGFAAAPCALCDGSHFASLAEKDRCGLLTPVVVCTDCGLVQTNPRMTARAYSAFYRAEYQALQNAGAAPEETFVAERARGRALITYLQRNRAWPASATPFVLDVGCGSAGLLSAFAELGWRTLGVDVAASRLELAKTRFGLELVDGTLADVNLRGQTPDLVVYSHSLEHVLEVNRELELLRGMLGSASIVYIEVPGIKRLDLYRDDFLAYLQNAHVYHFSLETLTQLMEKHRFERIVGDETVRALFRRVDRGVERPCRSDYLSVLSSLEEAEARARRIHVRSSARAILQRLHLMSILRSLRRSARRSRFRARMARFIADRVR
jgi:2-polyprenyl-3-methyl-5-hydroxy-6-metoxy-1,4-benzoquinol methylase